MCLAVPMEITAIHDKIADVEIGGVTKQVRLDIIDATPAVGDFVIIHAGFAIRKLDLLEAQQSLAILRELADAYDEVQRKYEQEELDRAKA